MGRFFHPDFGELEVTAFYSDNEIYCQEVRFAIPIEKWSEFETSPMYQQLKAFVHAQEIPDRQIQRHEAVCEPESEELLLRSMLLATRESFWVRVRRWFRDILLRG